MCDAKQQEECRAEIDDEDKFEWMCNNCPKSKQRSQDLHPYTRKLLLVRRLRQAGYPLAAGDLTYEEWLDLGRLEQCLETPRL